MHLKILLPTEVFADESDVRSIVAETSSGSFGLLEHRLRLRGGAHARES